MTRKPLPKAIRRPVASLRDLATDFAKDEQGRVPRSRTSFDAVEPEPGASEVSSDTPLHHAAVSQAHEASASVPIEKKSDTAETASMKGHIDPRAAKRLLANKIVDRHRLYAAGGGLVPLPVASIAGVTAVVLRMVKQLSQLYGVPFERDRTRSLVVSIIGGAVPTGLGVATTSTLAWIVPGGLLFGLAVSAVTAGALTRGIGLVFVESFESEALAREATPGTSA
jgi:uncharacterized protein (DUF697 family)